ncbi:DUF1294 domain-containing protein [Clostridium sp. 19966]|uniref:DUF1294 domain-containing protein n=1 Tax=Clostridium sp. 19966 TaxID=2768166 RepID=UPI0028DD73F6|nr:DUF1294 domain-containing protein [Clostridium sp. 19966]MDT8718713.1 DUF1294 domain-containing protein [Clostridium sp. 19966]
MKYFSLYLLVINIIAIVVMYKDKQYAKNHHWRIRESTLFIIALIFGSLGILIGMKRFRHKTKHLRFTIFIPLIALAQIFIIYRLFY